MELFTDGDNLCELGLINEDILQLNSMYEQTKRYLDNDFFTRIKENKYKFHQRWFEMSLINKLLNSNFILNKKQQGTPDTPDIGINLNTNNNLWIECTAPEPGVDDDWYKEFNVQKLKNFTQAPIDQMLLRITSAINPKINQINRIEKKIIAEHDVIILAINVALFSDFIFDEFLGLFEGWRDRGFYTNDPDKIVNFPCDKIIKSKNQAHINTAYFKQNNTPFHFVLFSSSKFKSCGSCELKVIQNENKTAKLSNETWNDVKKVLSFLS